MLKNKGNKSMAHEHFKRIINCFETLGYAVKPINGKKIGLPDILAAKDETNYLIIIKDKNEPIPPKQLFFAELWRGPIYIIRTQNAVIRFNNGNKTDFKIYNKYQELCPFGETIKDTILKSSNINKLKGSVKRGVFTL